MMKRPFSWIRWRLNRFALLGLLLTEAACPKKNESPMPTSDNDAKRMLLQTLLKQPEVTSKAFGEALLNHGPIMPEELPQLTTAAESSSAIARKNAVYLIGKIQTPAAFTVLLKLAESTQDPQVFVLAVSGLRNQPEGKTLARNRLSLAQRAMLDPDVTVQTAAVRVGFLSGDPAFLSDVEKRLRSPLQPVRDAVTATLAAEGAGPLEGALRDILLHPPADLRYGLADIYQALAISDDPTMGDVFRRSLITASVEAQTDFLNGVTLSRSRKPWLKELLLTMAKQDHKARWSVFERLAKWGPDSPETELVSICVQELETRLPKDPATAPTYDVELEACRNYLGALAKQRFEWGDLRRALEFANKRLSETK